MIIGNKRFEGGTFVMAIINVTPDSFYAPSRATKDSVLFAAERAIEEGAAVLDIGAQSTRPGYTEISAEEEIARIAEPIRRIKRRFDIPVSADTYYSKCARAALDEGADMINDIWGLTHDEDMAAVCAEYGASVCIMHNSRTPIVGDMFAQVKEFLQSSVNRALSAGISKDKILLDGGVGFGKSREQNAELIQNYGSLSSLGYPLLLGASRKSVFGGTPEERLAPTLAATRHAAEQGVLFVRVHDVKQNVAAIQEAMQCKRS